LGATFWRSPENAWIPVPSDWARNIVQGKTYDTDSGEGSALWEAVRKNLAALGLWRRDEMRDETERDRPEYLIKGRLGQGAFRILVTDAYHRRCAITGERTLPVLEAGHIKPYALSGPNLVQNGLLFRSDLHKLFDIGFLTVTPELRIEVSKRIKEEYENGREYYAYHGRGLAVMPNDQGDQPSSRFLQWHNENVFVP
jgi:putative restriction endonuclease